MYNNSNNTTTNNRVRTGHGKPGESWNLLFSRPGKSWNLSEGHGKSRKSSMLGKMMF